jgi:Flp pilus assembly pilin Flp
MLAANFGGRHMIKEFLLDEDGMGVVEVVLIIVVLVAIAAIFKKQIVALVNNIWTSINKDAKSIYS